MASTDLVTLAEVKAALEIVSSDTTKDAAINALILGVSLQLENWCRVPLVRRLIVERHATWNDRYLRLYRYPIYSVASIVDDAGNAILVADYFINRTEGTLRHFSSWPVPYDTIGNVGEWIVSFVAGRWSAGSDTGAATITAAATAGTYTRSAGSFLTDGFAIDQSVTISGFVTSANNGTKLVANVSALVLTIADNASMQDEAGGGNERIVTAATTNVPQDAKLAARMQIAHLLPRKSPGITSINTGTLALSFRDPGEELLLPEVRALMARYKGNHI
jgi:hypothetical protein